MGPAGGQGQTACKMVSVLPEVQIPWLQYWHCFLSAAWLTILSAQLSDTGRERERGSVCGSQVCMEEGPSGLRLLSQACVTLLS